MTIQHGKRHADHPVRHRTTYHNASNIATLTTLDPRTHTRQRKWHTRAHTHKSKLHATNGQTTTQANKHTNRPKKHKADRQASKRASKQASRASKKARKQHSKIASKQAEQSRAEQSRAEQSRAEQSRAEQSNQPSKQASKQANKQTSTHILAHGYLPTTASTQATHVRNQTDTEQNKTTMKYPHLWWDEQCHKQFHVNVSSRADTTVNKACPLLYPTRTKSHFTHPRTNLAPIGRRL